ncbi:MAG: hypothetical protein RXN79_01155 [Candidatus Nanopusillus sp.]
MNNYYKVATIDDLIERINMEINNQNEHDYNEYNLYKKRLKDFLKDLRAKYGNIPTIAAVSLIKRTNEKMVIKYSKISKGKEKIKKLQNLLRI